MIASFFDGRVRLRGEALKDKEFMANVKTLVSSREGILEIRDNLRTGSLLVKYDPAVITREDLLAAAAILENEAPRKDRECMPKFRGFSRKQETALLSAVYGLTIVGGFANKSLHIAAGALFTLLAAKHLYDRRRCL